MYIAGSEDIVRHHPGRIIIGRRVSEEPTDGRTKLPTAGLDRRFYRYGLSFTDIRMEFAGCLSGFTDTVQLFLVLATYCVVLGPIPSAEHLIERTLTHLSP